MQDSRPQEVPPLAIETTDQLGVAVRSLVTNKYIMDKMVAEHGTAMLAGDLHGGGYGPHEPLCFFRLVFPFVANDAKQPFFALVPTAHTLGCSWAWRKSQISEEKAHQALKETQDVAALISGDIDPVIYHWIKPLGLICPSEGKNRVDLTRESGINTIPARVRERDYPDAARIKIYSVKFAGAEEPWAVLDDRWVQRIAHPRWALPVLVAYGVKFTSRWPSNYPSLHTVAMAFDQTLVYETSALGHPDYPNQSTVDLDTVAAEGNFANEGVVCAGFELRGVTIKPRVWLTAVITATVGTLALGMIPNEWISLKVAAGMGLGAALGAIALFVSPVFSTSRKRLKKAHFLPPERAPKYKASQRRLG